MTALSLMAFMLVLVVTLMSLMEVETRSTTNNLELQRARDGARLALSMAVGKLQEYAGNDLRVTARADITGSVASGAEHWTGVWDSSSSSTADPSFAAWLVSGSGAINPENIGTASTTLDTAVGGNALELVGLNSVSAGETVSAPFTTIFDENGIATSRIAWWVGDEGTKASAAILPSNRRPNSSPNFVLDTSKNALKTMLASSHGLENIFPSYSRVSSLESSYIDRNSSIDYLINQTDFKSSQDFSYIDTDLSNVTESAFHTLTTISYGLLASTVSGVGLMQDLSQFPNLLLGAGFEQYVNRGFDAAVAKSSEGPGSLGEMQQSVKISVPSSIASLSPGDIVDFAAPILTNLMIAFAVYYPDDSSPAQVDVSFFSEFWNPYTSELLMSNGSDNYDLELRILGLPEVNIEMEDVNTGDATTSDDINLQTILSESSDTIDPVVVRLVYDQNEAWYPGMTKNWIGIINSAPPYVSNNTTNKTLTGLILNKSVPLSDVPNIASNDDVLGVSSTSNSTFDISVNLVDTSTGGIVQNIAQVNGIEYETISTPITNPLGNSNPSFGYQIILKGPWHSNISNRGDWLLQNDPRNPLSLSKYGATYNGLSALDLVPTGLFPHNLNSATIDIDRPERLFDRSDSSSSGTGFYNKLWQESPLFELPRERILSLASLQHLYFHDERPFKVGNSWGDDGTNTLGWFDQYFFSGIIRQSTPSTPSTPSDSLSSFSISDGFPNPTLVAYNNPVTIDLNNNSRSVAANAMVAGRFNLNSTSVSAWKAVLGGLRIDSFPFVDYYGGTDLSDGRPPSLTDPDNIGFVSRSNMFARFSNTLQETYDVFETPEDSNTIAPSEYYRRGVRYLTQQQVEDLAVNIVDGLKNRGDPFPSIESFLDNPDSTTGSVIEEAIAASVFTNSAGNRQQWDHSWETKGTGEGDSSDRIDIDHYSPGFLTQADVMTAIGPMLAPRSDTFKVRARCQTLSPADPNEVVGDVTIEAVVQRVPDPLDPGGNINNAIDRQFKIMSVRWLTADEI